MTTYYFLPSHVATLKALLDDFFATTGLTINFHKSTFVPIQTDSADATAMVLLQGDGARKELVACK
jgi:hypothetical protein